MHQSAESLSPPKTNPSQAVHYLLLKLHSQIDELERDRRALREEVWRLKQALEVKSALERPMDF